MKVFYKTLIILFITYSASLAQPHVVSMIDNEFVPADITVQEGDTVVWVNDGANIHTATSGANCTSDGTWDSGNMESGEDFAFIFSNAGDYPYFCMPHCGLGMDGSVTVEETSNSLSTSLENIKVYPNPVSDQLQVFLPKTNAADGEIILMDMQGKTVARVAGEISQRKVNLNVSGLSQGVYFIHLRKDGKSYLIKRVMKVE